MNTVSLNNLWVYLQGLTLSESNKKWLAAHLYEEVSTSPTPIKASKKSWPKLHKDDLVISPELMALVDDVDPLPADFNMNLARLDYLKKKYG